MKKIYINGTGCISAQKTFDSIFLDEAELNENDNILALKTPSFKDYISPAAIRRMANGVKNGIAASAMALKDASIESVDAIITGTGMGCIEDSESFLKGILDNNEQFLTPTSFIQSTHNTVGAQIALGLKCTAYNFTYVNGAVSFESALIDAKMLIEEGSAGNVLVGGIDETAEITMGLYKLAGIIKEDGAGPYKMLDTQTNGAVFGEGATFFVIGENKSESTYAEIKDISIINHFDANDVEQKAQDFLRSNSIDITAVDAIILGYNGEIDYDVYYKKLSAGIFKNTAQAYYKHLSGEYNTASAFGLWVGANIIKTQSIPEIIQLTKLDGDKFRNILLYNQYRGTDHSFILISACEA